MLVTKSYKYRMYPNVKQQVLLVKTFGCVRYYWNNLVASFNSYDKEINPIPVYKTSTELRKEIEWMNEVSAAALQQKFNDFQETKKQIFSKTRKAKVGRVRFKKKNNKQSYRLPNQKFRLLGNKIQIEKVGKISIVIDREIPIESKMLSVTISQNESGQYFASINFQTEQKIKIKSNGENIGIDLGVSSIAILSNGIEFANPKGFIKSQDKLRTAQKHLSRKKLRSNRWNKQRIKVARIHQKITNQRDWQLHNISTWVVNNFNEIAMEDLNVSGLIRNRKLSKAISDTAMSKLKTFISYKQKEFGKEVYLFPRFQPSSKKCSCCGNIQQMKLSQRVFECQQCGFVENRDVNAARNIEKAIGVNVASNERRENVSPIPTQVEWRQASMKRLA